MLWQIAAKKKLRVEERKMHIPLAALLEQLDHQPVRPFHEALLLPGISVIAEVKKASPAKGDFGLKITAAELAMHYEAGGARAISVLTEEDYFMGSVADLLAVRSAVTLPVLRKDFVIDSYQLYESRAVGADAVLLIAGFVQEVELAAMLEICEQIGLAALVETHNEAEIGIALRAGARVVGINNRNLTTFATDIQQTVKLAGLIPADVILVSESGIHTADDVRLLAAAGAAGVLVGESLVRASNPAEKIRELRGESER